MFVRVLKGLLSRKAVFLEGLAETGWNEGCIRSIFEEIEFTDDFFNVSFILALIHA